MIEFEIIDDVCLILNLDLSQTYCHVAFDYIPTAKYTILQKVFTHYVFQLLPWPQVYKMKHLQQAYRLLLQTFVKEWDALRSSVNSSVVP